MPIAVVTGANRGIGLEISSQLKDKNFEVIGVCRERSKALNELGIEVLEGVDLTDETSISQLVTQLDGRSIDLLVNNAGRLRRDSLEAADDDEVLLQFTVNALAPLRVTRALLPLLSSGAKIAHITSRMGSIEDNTSGGMHGYRMSKAALNAAGKSMALDLAPRGISVAILHPGFVRTDMTGGRGLIDTPESAAGLLARIDGLNLENSGSFWHMNGEVLPW